MTHQVYTRLFAISLIFLGYAAFTSDSWQNTADEPLSLSVIFEASSSAYSADPETSDHPVLAANHLLKIQSDLSHLAFSHAAIVTADSTRYNPFKPRAPPATVW